MHPCGYFDKEVLETLAGDLGRFYNCTVSYTDCKLELNNYYNPSRRQYDANSLIKSLSRFAKDESIKVIGVLRVDLFVPILTYIFGQAELGGTTGIVSLYRLRNELYGLEINNDLTILRFRKVVLHEAGHLFGLIHCNTPGCIMRSSTYVEDLDQKDFKFCFSCSKQISNLP